MLSLAARLGSAAPAWVPAAAAACGARGLAAAAGASSSDALASVGPLSQDGITTTVHGQAFVGDLRSTSALEVGDNVFNHTQKWLQVRVGSVHGRRRVGQGREGRPCLWLPWRRHAGSGSSGSCGTDGSSSSRREPGRPALGGRARAAGAAQRAPSHPALPPACRLPDA